LRTKELIKFKDLKFDDGAEGLSVERGSNEKGGKGKGKNHGSKSRPKGDGGSKFQCYYCQEPGLFKKDYSRRGEVVRSPAPQVAVSGEAYEEGYESAGELIVISMEP
jgi:hypothetical protein